MDCLVAELSSPVALLASTGGLEPSMLADLGSGALGYLVFEHHGAMVGLRGMAKVTPAIAPMIAFVVVDGVEVPERRGGERVPLETRAEIRPLGSGVESHVHETCTVNISLSGALLERPPGLPEAELVSIALYFGTDPEPLRSDARWVRSMGTQIGVHFETLAATDQTRLAEMLAGHQRRHGRAA